MGVIDQPIPRKSFEYISDRIAALLSDELYQQAAIQYNDDLLVRVFKDRMVPINASECPAVNVTYNDTDYKGETVISSDGISMFSVDIHVSAKTTPDGRGDFLAKEKAKRLAATIQGIIMDRRYVTLGFAPPFISNRRVEKIQISDPVNTSDGYSMVFARVTIGVRASETTLSLYPVVLAEFQTQVLIGYSDEGYVYSGTPGYAPTVTCSPASFLVTGVIDEDIDSGSTFILSVIDTDGNVPAMTYNSSLKVLTVPADSGGGSIDISLNGNLVFEDQTTNLDIEIVDSTDSATGNWNGTKFEIDNSTININTVEMISTPPASIVDLYVKKSDGTTNAGSKVGANWQIANSTISNSDDSYTASVLAEGSLELPDETFYFQIDGVTVATETEPALSTQTFNINWN